MANEIQYYTTWEKPEDFAKASQSIGKALYSDSSKGGIQTSFQRSTGAISNRFQDIDGTTSVRDSFSRLDYEFFRPNEQLPKRFRDIIFACNGVYQKVAIVRQIIDLMGDFCSSGIEIVHPNETIQRFYREWFKHVSGPERSERIANMIYRIGNVVVKRNTAKIDASLVSEWKRSVAETDLEMKISTPPGPLEIPTRYTLLNPIVLEVIGEEMAQFTGKVHLALKLPMNFYRSLNLPLTSFDPAILTEELPRDIQGAIDNHDRFLVLDPEKLVKIYYKKDDWDVWAYPLLYSILDDLILFQKMKLADLTALDGVISHIRVWKLGSLEHKIIPTDVAVNKLAGVLLNHMAGGAIDLIWGPDLELQETSTDVYKFLGGEKYEAVMAHINNGLGIPSSLSGEGVGFSNNFLSLRTLIERLEYGRARLIEFWEGEVKIVQKAMGFRYPAQVTFPFDINLNDETSERKLWIELYDRGLCSIETVQKRYGMIPEIEEIRLKRNRAMGIPKIGPYTDGEPDLSMKKIFAQRGVITPSEVGIELEEKSKDEENAIEMQGRLQKEAIAEKPKPVGVSGQGRPGGSKDSEKRKPRTVKPRSTAESHEDAQQFIELVLKGAQLQKVIDDIVNPYYLERVDKKNLRQLLLAEWQELETFKFWLLFNCEGDPKDETVITALSQPIEVYDYIEEFHDKLIAEFTKQKNVEPTYGELKYIRSYLYATFKGDY